MPDYKETPISGRTWRRAKAVRIDNPYLETPKILFEEEDVVEIGSTLIKTPYMQLDDPTSPTAGVLGGEFKANGSFPLIDPTTNLPLGVTMTHQELYVAFYSLYAYFTNLRDNPTP